MGPTDWFTGKDGELIAASGIRMTPRDLARIGQLMLRGGVWDDRVVVPAEWIARCTMPVVPIDGKVRAMPGRPDPADGALVIGAIDKAVARLSD